MLDPVILCPTSPPQRLGSLVRKHHPAGRQGPRNSSSRNGDAIVVTRVPGSWCAAMHGPVGAARNACLEAARAAGLDSFIFLDADDSYDANYVPSRLALLERGHEAIGKTQGGLSSTTACIGSQRRRPSCRLGHVLRPLERCPALRRFRRPRRRPSLVEGDACCRPSHARGHGSVRLRLLSTQVQHLEDALTLGSTRSWSRRVLWPSVHSIPGLEPIEVRGEPEPAEVFAALRGRIEL